MINNSSTLKEIQHLRELNGALIKKNHAAETEKLVLLKNLNATKKTNAQLTTQLTNLLEQIKLMNQRKFAASSEANLLQKNLFDELAIADSAQEQDPEDKTVTYTRKAKNKPKRKPLPESLERVVTVIDIDESDKVCDCCGGQRHKMGEEISEELAVVPATIYVNKTIRPKYVCNNKTCLDEKIYIQSLPPRILPKSYATPSLIADILTKKYVDHVPLYRQQQAWKRVNIDLPRNTMCAWLIQLAQDLRPLYHLLQKHILKYTVIHVDETTVQVLGEPDRTNQQKSYIWAYRGGQPDKPVVYFEYEETREAEHPIQFLKTYIGYVITDAYTGYDWINKIEGFRIIHIYCMSHARRNFAEIVKLTKTPGAAHTAIGYFQELYAIESYARDEKLTPEKRFILRLTKAKPVLDNLLAFLKEIAPKAPPGGKLGKAISYMLNREYGFYAYLSDGRLEIDNNPLENEIRPFAIGRKNWLFMGSPRGAEAACVFYTFIQSAKANNVEPSSYLTKILDILPSCKTEEDFEALLPWNIKITLEKDKLSGDGKNGSETVSDPP